MLKQVSKLSFLLTINALLVGLLVSFGCAHQRVARTQQPAKIAPSNEMETASTPLVTPKNSINPVLPEPATPRSISDPPPPAQVEVVGPPPTPDYTWLPGHWEWQGDWTWIPGKWAVVPHPRAAWIPGRWVHRENGWIWVTGYWRLASL